MTACGYVATKGASNIDSTYGMYNRYRTASCPGQSVLYRSAGFDIAVDFIKGLARQLGVKGSVALCAQNLYSLILFFFQLKSLRFPKNGIDPYLPPRYPLRISMVLCSLKSLNE